MSGGIRIVRGIGLVRADDSSCDRFDLGPAPASPAWEAQGADSGKLAPPREILSDRNGPSDIGSDSDRKRPS